MGADLPKGTWTAPLIGPWWPGPSTALRSAAQHWATWSTQKQELAQTLRHQRELLSQNQGKTAEDLISRYFQGEKSELDKAEKYKTKADALNSVADEIDYLRSRLTVIANEGNKEIDDVLASKKPLPEQLAEMQAIQAWCNADAAKASGAAVNKIMAATQKILEAEGIHGDARTWAREHGFNTDDVPPPVRSARGMWIRLCRVVLRGVARAVFRAAPWRRLRKCQVLLPAAEGLCQMGQQPHRRKCQVVPPGAAAEDLCQLGHQARRRWVVRRCPALVGQRRQRSRRRLVAPFRQLPLGRAFRLDRWGNRSRPA